MSLTIYLVCALIALLTYVLFRIKQHYNYFHSLGIPCEENPSLLVGSMHGLQTEFTFQDIALRYYNKFKGSGPFAGFYWFQCRAVLVLEPSLAKLVLIKEFNKFTNRPGFSNVEDDPLSGHLFMLEGQSWRNMRNKLSPTFTSGKMKYMFPTLIKVGEEFLRVFEQTVNVNEIVEVRDLLARFTTDVIGCCAFGIDCNSLKDPQAEFRVMGSKAFTVQRHGKLGMAFINGFPELAHKLRMKQTPDFIEEFYLRIVRETVETREKHNIRRNDFMDMLIDLKNNKMLKSETGEEMKNLTLNEIAAQAFLFLVAGFETSSTAMSFALYELAQHEAIQQRVRDEVNESLAQHNGEFTYECMKKLFYLDQVISETLRLYTSVPMLFRKCSEDYVVPDHPKYVIKKGMLVLISTVGIHRDADYYPNPNDFNPDNFAAEIVRQRDSVEWLPFGDGPRNCIGMRFGQMITRIGLALLLKNYKFTTCSKTQIPMVFDKKQFLLSPSGGIYLKAEKL